MANNEGLAYRMYEEYYKRADEAYRSGRMAEAKRLYYSAGEQLLMAAKEAGGETRNRLLARSDKLTAIADAIVVSASPRPAGPGEQSGSGKSADSQASGASRDLKRQSVQQSQSGDENTEIFTPEEHPNVHFEDIAGLEDVKEIVRNRIILPRKYPETFKAYDLSLNAGILLYGPPGTGKTMMAKAIATEVDSPFYSIRCSNIVGMYFGQAEKNVKALFEAARSWQSAVVFFDEFEALAARRGGHSTVMNRLVPELLSQIDGFTTNKEKSLTVIGATNRPWDLDTAFLRPPRMTERVYVGLPDAPAREYLVRRALSQAPCDPDVNVERIVEITDGFNAADVTEFCNFMKMRAARRSIEQTGGAQSVPISASDLEEAAGHVRSSVQKEDLINIQKWEASQPKQY